MTDPEPQPSVAREPELSEALEPECQDTECSEPADASVDTYVFYGIWVRMRLCPEHRLWVEKFYAEDRAAARYGK